MWRNKINALSAAFSFNDSRVLTVHASIPMLVKYGSRTSDLFGRIKKTYSVPWHRIVPTRWIRCRYPHRFEGAWTLNRFSWKWAYLLPLWLLLSNTLQEGGREISPMFFLYGPDWVWGHALLMPFSLRNTFVGKLTSTLSMMASKGDAVLFQGKQAWFYCPSYRESWRHEVFAYWLELVPYLQAKIVFV